MVLVLVRSGEAAQGLQVIHSYGLQGALTSSSWQESKRKKTLMRCLVCSSHKEEVAAWVNAWVIKIHGRRKAIGKQTNAGKCCVSQTQVYVQVDWTTFGMRAIRTWTELQFPGIRTNAVYSINILQHGESLPFAFWMLSATHSKIWAEEKEELWNSSVRLHCTCLFVARWSSEVKNLDCLTNHLVGCYLSYFKWGAMPYANCADIKAPCQQSPKRASDLLGGTPGMWRLECDPAPGMCRMSTVTWQSVKKYCTTYSWSSCWFYQTRVV